MTVITLSNDLELLNELGIYDSIDEMTSDSF